MKYGYAIPFGLLSCAVAKWQPVDETSFRQALKINDQTLIAYILIPAPSTEADSTDNENRGRRTSKQPPATISARIQGLTPSSKSLNVFEEEWAYIQTSDKEGAVLTVDCAANGALCREFDVVSFPTIRLHRQDGRVERYRGARKAKDISSYSRRMSRPTVSRLDAKNASSFTSVDDIVVVAHLDQDNKGLEERFTTAAQQFCDRYSFAIRERKGHGASLECMNNVNFEQLSITDLSDALAIDSFVKQCAQPLIPEFTRRNELEYSKMGKSIVHYFVSSDEDRESYTSAIRTLAKRYKEYLLFVTTDVNEYPQMLSMTGHKPNSNNVVSVVNPLNGGVFPYRGKDITADTIEGFLGDVSSGKVKPWDGLHMDEDIRHEEL